MNYNRSQAVTEEMQAVHQLSVVDIDNQTISNATGEWVSVHVRCMHRLRSKLGLLSGVFDSTSVLNSKTLFERLFQELLVRFHDGQSRSKRWPSTRKINNYSQQSITLSLILLKNKKNASKTWELCF